MRGARRTFLCAVALGIAWLSPPALAQTNPEFVTIERSEGRSLARQAVLDGQFDLARDIALALLDADKHDPVAHIVLAAVWINRGENLAARRSAASAYRAAETPAARYEAARLAALASSNAGQLLRAQIWLRRAATHAPNENAFAQNATDFRQVARSNPLNLSFNLSFAPTNNVNGGSESAFNIIDGIPIWGILSPDAQALSGFVASADLRASYRLSEDQNQRTSLSLRLYDREVWLSKEAQDAAPDSDNGDFAYAWWEVSANQKRLAGDWALDYGLSIGRSYSAGVADKDRVTLTASALRPLSERLAFTAYGELGWRRDVGSAQEPDAIRSLGAGARWISNGERLAGAFSAQVVHQSTSSPFENNRSEITRMQLSYQPQTQPDWAQLKISLGASFAHYPDYTVLVPVPGGREDYTGFGTIELELKNVSYAGFAPVLTLSHQQTDSNVSRFDTRQTDLRIGFRSQF